MFLLGNLQGTPYCHNEGPSRSPLPAMTIYVRPCCLSRAHCAQNEYALANSAASACRQPKTGNVAVVLGNVPTTPLTELEGTAHHHGKLWGNDGFPISVLISEGCESVQGTAFAAFESTEEHHVDKRRGQRRHLHDRAHQ